jgi:hypothetical protein
VTVNQKFSVFFAGSLAYILIILYVSTLGYVIWQVCTSGGKPVNVSSGLTYVLTTIGGLVSALVLARLTLTPPGEDPAKIDFSTANKKDLDTVKNLTFIYMLIWLIAGLAALVIGTVVFPGVNSTLSDIGTTWLGLAVSSVYVYFGLNKTEPT